MTLSFLPETLDVDRNIAKKLLNSLFFQQPIYVDEDVDEHDYGYDCSIVHDLI
jgi:hypothetical protein